MSSRPSRIFLYLAIFGNLVFARLWLLERHKSSHRAKIVDVETFCDKTSQIQSVKVEFATPMVWKNELGSPVPLTVQPDFKHDFFWTGERTAVLRAKKFPPPGTILKLTPKPRTRDRIGQPLPRDSRTVTLSQLKVLGLASVEGVDGNHTRLELEFNGVVDPRKVREKLAVLDSQKHKIPVEMDAGNPARRIGFVVPHPVGETKIEVLLKRGLVADGGTIGIQGDFACPVTIGRQIHIGELSTRQSEAKISIVFSISGFPEMEELRKHLTITPKGHYVLKKIWRRDQYMVEGDFKPDAFYRFRFAKGLVGNDGMVLAEDSDRTVVTPSLLPYADFLSEGPYFSSKRALELPVTVEHVDEIYVYMWRVYPNNLPYFFDSSRYEYQWEKYGYFLGTKLVKTTSLGKGEGTLRLRLGDLYGIKEPGVYRVSMYPNTQRYQSEKSRFIIYSDLALTAVCDDGSCTAWVRRLSDNSPVAGAEVGMYTRKNQCLGTVTTNAEGLAVIPYTSLPGEENDAFLLLAKTADDTTAMELPEQQHGTTEYEISGIKHERVSSEAFVYTERDMYRPGETVHLSTIVRDRETQKPVSAIPLLLTVTNPFGSKLIEQPLQLSEDGFASHSFPIPREEPTGTYRIRIAPPLGEGDADVDWGSGSFRVGDFMPDRIRVKQELTPSLLRSGQPVKGRLEARYFFGNPAANHSVLPVGNYRAVPFRSKLHADLEFPILDGDDYYSQNHKLPPFKTDAEGKADFSFPLWGETSRFSPTEVVVANSVCAPGGRTVSAASIGHIHSAPFYLGLKHVETSGAAKKKITVRWGAVSAADKPVCPESPFAVELHRIVWDYALRKNNDGGMYYAWEKEVIPVVSTELPIKPDATEGIISLSCEESGNFILSVRAADGKVQTRIKFWHSQGGDGARPTHLASLTFTTDRNSYRPGETAILRTSIPFAGQAMVVVAADRVRRHFSLPVQPGENHIPVAIPADLTYSNVYVAVTAVANRQPENFPRRLFGISNIPLNQQVHRLGIGIGHPKQVVPETRQTVEISLTCEGKPCAGNVHVFAVDEGILSLTGCKTPDPFSFFFGKCLPGVTFHDFYTDLFPQGELNPGKVSAIGGGGQGRLSHIPIENVASAIVFSQPVSVPAEGKTSVVLPLPDHTGALRIMAVAFNAGGVGSAESEIQLARPADLLLSAPRFLAPGDTFSATASVFNNRCPERSATVSADFVLRGEKPVTKTGRISTLEVPEKEMRPVSFSFTSPAEICGTGDLIVTLALGKQTVRKTLPITIRPASPRTIQAKTLRIPAGESATFDMGGAWFAGAFDSRVRVCTSLAAETAVAVHWLRKYPYACLEQTASAAIPMLYWDVFANKQNGGDEFTTPLHELQRGIRRLRLLARYDGGFGMWPGSPTVWELGSLHACHFLAEAAIMPDVSVDGGLLDNIDIYLDRLGRGKKSETFAGEHQAYALYLLALLGKPKNPIAAGMMEDTAFSPFARFIAACALAKGGKRTQAGVFVDLLLPQIGAPAAKPDVPNDIVERRALAAVMLLDTYPDHGDIPKLIEKLTQSRNARGHWGTTRRNALVVMAMGKWVRLHETAGDTTGTVVVGGETFAVAKGKAFEGSPSPETPLKVSSAGSGPVFASWFINGVPKIPPRKNVAQGIVIRRKLLDLQGQPKQTFAKGEICRVRLEFENGRWCENVVISDLIPGGFTVEDPSLETRWSPGRKSASMGIDYVENRPDRMLIFGTLFQTTAKKKGYFEYTLRAVSPGDYLVPRTTVEAMYDPEIRAETGADRRVTIQ